MKRLFISLVLLLTLVSKASATECDAVPLPIEFLRTPYVFIGKVTDVHQEENTLSYEFEITYSFKDSIAFQPIVDIAYISAAYRDAKLFGEIYAPSRRIGESFIVFAYPSLDKPAPYLVAGICSSTISMTGNDYHALVADLYRFSSNSDQYLKSLWFENAQLNGSERASVVYDSLHFQQQLLKPLQEQTEKKLFFLQAYVSGNGEVRQIQPLRFSFIEILQAFHIPLKVQTNQGPETEVEQLLMEICAAEFQWTAASVDDHHLNAVVLIGFEVDDQNGSVLIDTL